MRHRDQRTSLQQEHKVAEVGIQDQYSRTVGYWGMGVRVGGGKWLDGGGVFKEHLQITVNTYVKLLLESSGKI